MLLAPAVAQGAVPGTALPWTATEWAIAGMVVLNAIGFVFFVVLLRSSGPVFASQMSYVITLCGMILGALFFAERPSAWIMAATALMFAGIFLVRARSAKR
jgi:drug/metabolite transporter (DMT)-like permease